MATQPASPRRPRPVIVGEARRYGPAEVFWGGAGRGDCGSSGCLAPEGRPVRPLCPGLLVLRAGCFRDRGSPGADIATFDPQSRNSPVMVVGLFCFMAVRRRSAGCSRAGDPRSRRRTAGGPQGTGPATGRHAGSGAPVRSGTETAANAGLLPDRSHVPAYGTSRSPACHRRLQVACRKYRLSGPTDAARHRARRPTIHRREGSGRPQPSAAQSWAKERPPKRAADQPPRPQSHPWCAG
jgi:hypothetical protein